MDAPIRRLDITDAAPLAHAYAHAVATSLGVRALSIKGPAADHHGVRGPHVSADADLLSSTPRASTSLWRDRASISVAGRPVAIPSRDATILIAALHALRRWTGFASRADDELAELHARFGSLDIDSRARLDALAHETGCVETLHGALRDLGVSDATGSRRDDPALRAWPARVAAGGTGTHFWLRRLERLPWRSSSTRIMP